MAAPLLASKRLLLRHWSARDLHPLALMNSDPEVMRYAPDMMSYDQSEIFGTAIQIGLEVRDYGLWAIELSGNVSQVHGPFIGFAGLAVPTWQVSPEPSYEIGWRLNRSYWGSGYATEAAARVLDYAFFEMQLKQVLASAPVLNTRSTAVMERLQMWRQAPDFDHPAFSSGHKMCRHAHFSITASRWSEVREMVFVN